MAQQREMSYRTFIEDFPSFCIIDAISPLKAWWTKSAWMDGLIIHAVSGMGLVE